MSAGSFRTLRFAIRCNDLVARAEGLRSLPPMDPRRLHFSLKQWETFGHSAAAIYEFSGDRLEIRLHLLKRLHRIACQLLGESASHLNIVGNEFIRPAGRILRSKLNPPAARLMTEYWGWSRIADITAVESDALKAAEVAIEMIAAKAGRPANTKFGNFSNSRRKTHSGSVQKKPNRGGVRIKLISALMAHHKYDDRSCLNFTPIGVRELSRVASVSAKTVSLFFRAAFGGFDQYRLFCRNGKLTDALKLLDGSYSPHKLLGRSVHDRLGRDDD